MFINTNNQRYLPNVKPAFMLEPLDVAEPKLKVAVLLPVLGVTSSFGFSLSVAAPSTDLDASLQIRKH